MIYDPLYEFVSNSIDSSLYPKYHINCINPRYWIDKEDNVIYIRCGKCVACRRRQGLDWSTRLYLENKCYDSSYFISLTYSNDNLPCNGKINKFDLRKFIQKVRNNLDYKISFFGTGEYGPKTKRPHYHLILFGLKKEDCSLLNSFWSKGFITFAPLSLQRCSYVCGYVVDKIRNTDTFSIMSRCPAIGFQYFYDNYKEIFKNGFISIQGQKRPIPRAFFRKLKEIDNDFYSQFLESLKDYDKSDTREFIAQMRKIEQKQVDFIKKRSFKENEI